VKGLVDFVAATADMGFIGWWLHFPTNIKTAGSQGGLQFVGARTHLIFVLSALVVVLFGR
jgi:hypothetical protein